MLEPINATKTFELNASPSASRYAATWVLSQLPTVEPNKEEIFVQRLTELIDAALARKPVGWEEDLTVGVYTCRKIDNAAALAGIQIEGRWLRQFTVYVSTTSVRTFVP